MRAELLGRVVAAEFDLENAIAELTRNGGASAIRAQSEAQLHALARLQQQIGRASPTALAAMRTEIAAAVAATQSVAQQGRAAAASDAAAELAELADASRQTVSALVRDLHRFDPYLQFASSEDEAEYRRREADRLAYIAAEQGKGTPEGDLNASGAMVGQMVDAHAHGAGDSPEFQTRWNELVATTERLREAARAAGIPTDEFNRRLREDLRRILRAKGLSDTQIDALFAANPDPLEAAKAYMQGDGETLRIEEVARNATRVEPTGLVATEAPVNDERLGDAIARLHLAGATRAEPPPAQVFEHGVAVQERTVQPGRSGLA